MPRVTLMPGYAAFRKLPALYCETAFAGSDSNRRLGRVDRLLHAQTADVPDKPREFAGDRNDRDILVFALRHHSSIPSTQTQLCVPGSIDNHLGHALMTLLNLGAHFGRMPITPGGLDQQLSRKRIARLGDAALAPAAPR